MELIQLLEFVGQQSNKYPNLAIYFHKLYTWLKWCGKYGFVGVIEYQSNIIFWAKRFLLTCNPETDLIADTSALLVS